MGLFATVNPPVLPWVADFVREIDCDGQLSSKSKS